MRLVKRMKIFDNYEAYIASRRGTEYRVNIVVEEEKDSFIVMSIRHSFVGDRNDGLFVMHFMEGLKNVHYTIHHDGTRHFKISDRDGRPIKMPMGNCGKLSEMKQQTQVLAGAIPLEDIASGYSQTSRDINRFAQNPDQIITLNRKHAARASGVSYSMSIVPSYVNDIRVSGLALNPNLYLFNLAEPKFLLEFSFESLPQQRSIQQKIHYDRINIVEQKSSKEKVWVDFEPRLLLQEQRLEIPRWTFWCRGQSYEMRPALIDLRDGCRLIVGEFNGDDYYYYDTIGAKISYFDNGVMPTIVWVENNQINILRSVSE